jgi:hypothetical protein
LEPQPLRLCDFAGVSRDPCLKLRH